MAELGQVEGRKGRRRRRSRRRKEVNGDGVLDCEEFLRRRRKEVNGDGVLDCEELRRKDRRKRRRTRTISQHLDKKSSHVRLELEHFMAEFIIIHYV
jgi:hypothetical protein